MADRSAAYKQAGVDIDAANTFVKNIGEVVASTFTKGVITDIGGFGGLYKPDMSSMKTPVLVGATDGVGTKLKLAFEFNKHDTIGIDLVAMSVNDILVQGAKPLFFLDYFATGKLETGIAEMVVASVCDGCKEAETALLGGETAEMPGFYSDGEYDLSGFCVGMVDNDNIVDGSTIAVGDRVIGVASSGFHSNGYSLVRKLLNESGLVGCDPFPGTDKSVAEVLLEPTRIYVRPIRMLQRDLTIKGMVHVTGGGFYDNIPRILPRNVSVRLQFGAWPMLPCFDWAKEQGNLTWPEMLQIFNCGLGYLLVVSPQEAEEVIQRLNAMEFPAYDIGVVEHLKDGQEQVTFEF